MMIYPEKIDLHMHSNVSDGSDTPAEILENVKKAGITFFALSDHDAIAGCVTIQSLLKEGDPQFIPSVEFSCKDELGKYHILGYCYDTKHPAIQAVVDLGHSYRMKKLNDRLIFIKEKFGFEFSEEDVKGLYQLSNPGKPHLGNLMAKYGFAPSKDIAISHYLSQIHSKSDYVRPEEAIRGILDAGGIPVLAHPSYGDGSQLIMGIEMEERIKRLMTFGLQGVEGYYSGFSAKLSREIIGYADKYHLYVTAGSDYHGTNKLISLGDTGIESMDNIAEGLKRFLQDVGACK